VSDLEVIADRVRRFEGTNPYAAAAREMVTAGGVDVSAIAVVNATLALAFEHFQAHAPSRGTGGPR
jgi:hypothetical protein